MIVLGIETSCDETAVSIISGRKVLSEKIYSQEVHAKYGGVVPELASRDHIKKLFPLTREAFSDAGLAPQDIEGVAVSAGPGLPGALLVGTTFAKGLATALNIPIIAINHLEGHIFIIRLLYELPTPFLALLVSGGHTELVLVKEWGEYDVLGTTRDDAAGEAFDKAAKALGLPYPGGPSIEKLAKNGNPKAFDFPRAMLKSGDLDFSFSGLKTALINMLRKLKKNEVENRLADIAASFQEAVVDSLIVKLADAVRLTGTKYVALVGGVAANERLREKVSELGVKLYAPPKKYCTDNATMIACAGEFYLEKGVSSPLTFSIKPNWGLQ